MSAKYIVTEIQEITGLDEHRRPMTLFRVYAETIGKVRFHLDIPESQSGPKEVGEALDRRANQLDDILKL